MEANIVYRVVFSTFYLGLILILAPEKYALSHFSFQALKMVQLLIPKLINVLILNFL